MESCHEMSNLQNIGVLLHAVSRIVLKYMCHNLKIFTLLSTPNEPKAQIFLPSNDIVTCKCLNCLGKIQFEERTAAQQAIAGNKPFSTQSAHSRRAAAFRAVNKLNKIYIQFIACFLCDHNYSYESFV